ncbi:MAG: hypothetical protein ACREA8_09930 [Nitrosotalea sp.]
MWEESDLFWSWHEGIKLNLPRFSFRNNGFILALAGLAILFVYAVIVPTTTTYPFETITKFQGNYHKPIYIIFHWESKDELMVGKFISVHADIVGLPYDHKDNFTNITMHLDGLNYFTNGTDTSNNKISTHDTLKFRLNLEKNIAESDPIIIRYILPVDESVELCDPILQSDCMTISGIIHPSPHDTFVQIDTGRANAGVSLAILLATIVIVWHSLAQKNPAIKTSKSDHYQKVFLIIVFLSLAGAIIFEYWFKWNFGDLG